MHSTTNNEPASYTESSPPNFTSSFYSLTKSHVEPLLASYPNTLTLRLRMPVSPGLHPRSFLTKITKYAHIVDIPNSHTLLHTLLPCAVLLAAEGETGVYNFTNPGRALSHNDVLQMYKEIVDSEFTWANFSLEQQSKVIKAGRSNCRLDAGKLVKKMKGMGVEVMGAEEAWREALGMMRNGKTDWVRGMAMGIIGCHGVAKAMGVEGMAMGSGMGMDGKENHGPARMLANRKMAKHEQFHMQGANGEQQEVRDVDGGMRVL